MTGEQIDQLIEQRDYILNEYEDTSLIARTEKLGFTLQRLMRASESNRSDVRDEALEQLNTMQIQLNSIKELLDNI